MDESQNRRDLEINPVGGKLQMVNDLEMGWSVRNVTKAPFYVRDGFTRMYPNLSIPEGMTVDVQDGGELMVP